MEIKRLAHADFDKIKELFWKCHEAEAVRNTSKTGADLDNNLTEISKLWEIWSTGIQKYYLNDDDYHFLYGIFDNNQLISIVGWRCDLPPPYNNDWVIVYLKSDPSINSLKHYVSALWDFMFSECENRGLTTWHSLIKPTRWSKFDAFYQRMIPNINNRYDYITLCEIPAGTQPSIDWVWGMMGRRPLKSDYIVRTGIRKK